MCLPMRGSRPRLRPRRGTALIAAALTGLLVLASCGDDGSNDSDGPVSLRMTIWSANEAHTALFNEIANEYRSSHPRVSKITFDPLPFDNYLTTLTTQIAGGNAPDLAWISETAIRDLVAASALAPIDDKLRTYPGYAFDDLIPAAVRPWQSAGKLYAYPFSTSPFGMFVNTDLIKAAGQPSAAELIAAGRWDWPTAMATAAAITSKTGKAGIVVRDFEYKNWDYLSTIWIGWGAETWSANGRDCGFDDPAMVDAMTFIHRSIFTDKAMPGPGSSADFFAGEAAMTISQISRASLLSDRKFGWDLVRLPAGPKGSYSVIGQGAMGVLRKSRHQAEAADFLAFLTNPDNSAKLARFFPPPRRSLLTTETLAKTNQLLAPEQLRNVVIDGITNGVVRPTHTNGAELSQSVRAALDPLWKSDADVGRVLGGVCRTIKPLLAK